MAPARHLDWDGLLNARDLGGIPLPGGSETRAGAFVRSDGLDHLTAAGWARLCDYGVRTVIDLRNPDERETDRAERPAGLRTVELPLDEIEDREFWDEWETQAPPLYYRPFLERFPQRSAAVIAELASAAETGAVLFHCVGGRDRTGMIAILMLALAGVTKQAIIDDYLLSVERTPAMYSRLGLGDVEGEIAAALAARDETVESVLTALLDELDADAYLREAGVAERDLARLRGRLTG